MDPITAQPQKIPIEQQQPPLSRVEQIIRSILPHISPPSADIRHLPLPRIINSDAITGIYFNILFPEERQNQGKPALLNWILAPCETFIQAKEFNTLNDYGLKSVPRRALSRSFNKLAMQGIDAGKTVDDALAFALREMETGYAKTLRETILPFLQRFLRDEKIKSTQERFKILINAIESNLRDLQKSVSYSQIQKGNEKGIEEVKKLLSYEAKSEEVKHSDKFEFRCGVIEQAVEDILARTPHSACFLALQEVTPDALCDLKTKWKHRNFNWISYNNISGNETRTISPEEESVFGETMAFTSTLALSPELAVQRVAQDNLPSPSGSKRKILGVEVLNTKTGKPFSIFTTHTDHMITPTLYSETARKIHEFIRSFSSGPWIMGGDCNVFEGSGGEDFYQQLKRSAKDYRETTFYVEPAIKHSSFIGRGPGPFSSKMEMQEDGTLKLTPPNALDQIFVQGMRLIAATRSAAVHDDDGKLLDPYQHKAHYYRQLQQWNTASDHLMNAVVFEVERAI